MELFRGRAAVSYLPVAVMVALAMCTLALPYVISASRREAGGSVEAAPDGSAVLRSPLPGSRSTPDEALYYDRLPGSEVQCRLCPNNCLIGEGERGDCRVRENRRGRLYSLVYGKPCALSVEPIEKAPFYHFLPGASRLCLATVGCNLRCSYCQNWSISQARVEEAQHLQLSPQQVVDRAIAERVRAVCFTFTEPTVFYEYMLDIATLAKKRGLATCMVSAGFINPEPLARLLEVLDAVKIDLKGFTEDFYRDVTCGELEPVLETLRRVRASGVWLEIVNLVVPTLNDDPRTITEMCRWIRREIGGDVPVHFTRFFPMYRLLNLPATPIATLERACRIAEEAGLKHVYIGNVPGHEGGSTFCPSCRTLLIERRHFDVVGNRLEAGRCPSCGTAIAGRW